MGIAEYFFVFGFDGLRISLQTKKLLKRGPLGGLILFDRNIESPKQVKTLVEELKALSGNPYFVINIDQEGGRFQRLKPPYFGAYPRACDISEGEAYGFGSQMGEELSSLGINQVNAPVLDVNTNPSNPIIGDRAFSNDPAKVYKIAKEYIRGLQDKGVFACGKHFPGHGDTELDSHLALPVVKHSKKHLEKYEFYPFKELIPHGLKFMMTAHVLYTELDKNNSATFSQKILGQILRDEWHYEGLVISDDLGMAGALVRGDLDDMCLEAFAAGCDLLLVCDHHERHPELIEKLEKAIKKSSALQARAEESLKRIQRIMQTRS